jgi:hypothetical protein
VVVANKETQEKRVLPNHRLRYIRNNHDDRHFICRVTETQSVPYSPRWGSKVGQDKRKLVAYFENWEMLRTVLDTRQMFKRTETSKNRRTNSRHVFLAANCPRPVNGRRSFRFEKSSYYECKEAVR